MWVTIILHKAAIDWLIAWKDHNASTWLIDWLIDWLACLYSFPCDAVRPHSSPSIQRSVLRDLVPFDYLWCRSRSVELVRPSPDHLQCPPLRPSNSALRCAPCRTCEKKNPLTSMHQHFFPEERWFNRIPAAQRPRIHQSPRVTVEHIEGIFAVPVVGDELPASLPAPRVFFHATERFNVGFRRNSGVDDTVRRGHRNELRITSHF